MEIKVLIEQEKIENKIKFIANEILSDYGDEEIVLICILKGSVFFTTQLAKNLGKNTIIDFMKVSSYEGSKSTGKINFSLDISQNITGKNVIIVEDIIDTGKTLEYISKYLSEKNPKSLKICCMLNKEERRISDIKADYICFDIPDKFVVGYGLDYNEKYRCLPYIGYIETENRE